LALDESGEHHAPAILPSEKAQYPWNRRAGGPQSCSRRCGEEKNLLLYKIN